MCYVKQIFFSTVTRETFKTNHKLNCDDKCLIYISFLQASVVVNNIFEKPLRILGLGWITINVI